jgi:hypothetical protein
MDYADDPLFAPLARRLVDLERLATAAEQRARLAEQRLAQHAQTALADRYRAALERLAQAHPQLDRQRVLAEAARLARTTAVFGAPDPADVVTIMTHDDAVQRARQEGFEAGRRDGRRQAPPPPAPPPSSPFQSLDELEEAAARDPDILRTFEHP